MTRYLAKYYRDKFGDGWMYDFDELVSETLAGAEDQAKLFFTRYIAANPPAKCVVVQDPESSEFLSAFRMTRSFWLGKVGFERIQPGDADAPWS